MNKEDKKYASYLSILREELRPATGCTEPISLAYAAAKARELLGKRPTEVRLVVSENILKNTMGVVIPHTKNLKGVEAAVAAGVVAGVADLQLDVLAEIDDTREQEILGYIKDANIAVELSRSGHVFDVDITVKHEENEARVRLLGHHTNVVRMEKNGEIVYKRSYRKPEEAPKDPRNLLTIADILDFADSVNLDDIAPLIKPQIENSVRISKEGLNHSYGANVGSVLRRRYGDDVKNLAKAKSAAASDARMGGSSLPVTIVSGSGNQGITVSMPLIVFAEEKGIDREKLYRALVVSNLITVHQKTGVGCLSAYCGVVFAGAAGGAGIAYLEEGGYEAVAHTIVNALAVVSGIVCDGAKPSCAAKIAAAVDAGILGYQMYLEGQEFLAGEGILAKGVEQTIANVSRLARDGMRVTDKEIVDIMMGSRP